MFSGETSEKKILFETIAINVNDRPEWNLKKKKKTRVHDGRERCGKQTKKNQKKKIKIDRLIGPVETRESK